MDEQYSEQTSHVVPAEEMMIFLRDLETLRSTKWNQYENLGSVAVKCKKIYILKCKIFFAQNCLIHQENQ